MLSGKHLISGEWIATDKTFEAQPITGEPAQFCAGTMALVNQAAEAAEAAFASCSALPRSTRAAFLHRIADEIEPRGAAITKTGCLENGLPAARLNGERGRTAGQLRLLASHIEEGGIWTCATIRPSLTARRCRVPA